MLWYGGMSDSYNPYHNIVEDFFNKKMLTKLGYTFDGHKLSDLDVEAYNVIAVEAAKLEKADIERDSKLRGKNGK